MDLAELVERFSSSYPGVPPIGYELRDAFAERWMRIHSLPESRRYPESEADWRELVRRHRAVADAVVGPGAPALVVATHFPDEGEPDPGADTGLAFSEWPGTLPDELEGGAIIAAPIAYEFRRIESLVRRRADDAMGPLLVFAANGRIYAPYDGGADLFLRDASERDAFRTFFADWLSRREDGL